mmetsp:Transcript_13873/g.41305  ORF Transcript_13873/g.41305 Transcript_13873/m.41305 type:complete len:108 (+) Transcript_13873:338-661(+)
MTTRDLVQAVGGRFKVVGLDDSVAEKSVEQKRDELRAQRREQVRREKEEAADRERPAADITQRRLLEFGASLGLNEEQVNEFKQHLLRPNPWNWKASRYIRCRTTAQ